MNVDQYIAFTAQQRPAPEPNSAPRKVDTMSFPYAKKLCGYYDGLSLWAPHRDWSRAAGGKAGVTDEHRAFAETLTPALTAFEQSRIETMTAVEAGFRMAVPLWGGLGLLTGIGAAVLFKSIWPLLALPVAGLGYGVRQATQGPARAYRETFKAEIIPKLLARFGAFARVKMPTIETSKLADAGLLPDNAALSIDDQITGTYRGLALTSAELRAVVTNSDDEDQIVFDGQIIQIVLPRPLSGTTVLMGRGAGRTPKIPGIAPVMLENSRLMELFEVHSTDQVSARVLFSPAYQERFINLEAPDLIRSVKARSWSETLVTEIARMGSSSLRKNLGGLGGRIEFGHLAQRAAAMHIIMLAEDNKLLIAIPKSEEIDYFEPPPYHQEIDAEAMLMHLAKDMDIMLQFADAVLELDYRTKSQEKPKLGFVAA